MNQIEIYKTALRDSEVNHIINKCGFSENNTTPVLYWIGAVLN
ncbi:hypothetical protein [Psychrobacillus sp. FJAT-21963]|nr:hypothetical protein [Psychrobacillus sp. FJAT-21963]